MESRIVMLGFTVLGSSSRLHVDRCPAIGNSKKKKNFLCVFCSVAAWKISIIGHIRKTKALKTLNTQGKIIQNGELQEKKGETKES